MFYRSLRHFFSRSTKYWACHEKWARGITESSACPKPEWRQLPQNVMFDPFKPSSKFPKDCACQNCLQKHLPSRPAPANALTTSKKRHTCHEDEKVSDVLHLSGQTTFQTSKCPRCPTPATRNGHTFKKLAAPSDEPKPSPPHLARACAGEMHMDISQGNSYASIYSKNAAAQMELMI